MSRYCIPIDTIDECDVVALSKELSKACGIDYFTIEYILLERNEMLHYRNLIEEVDDMDDPLRTIVQVIIDYMDAELLPCDFRYYRW